MQMRFLKSSEDFAKAQCLIKNSVFTAGAARRRALHEVICDGLSDGAWTGIGLFDDEDDLVSCLCFKQVTPRKIEFGICCTDQDYRFRGYMTNLLKNVIAANRNAEFAIGTYRGNIGMIKCLRNVGFQEDDPAPRDRFNSRSPVHYTLKPRNGMDVYW